MHKQANDGKTRGKLDCFDVEPLLEAYLDDGLLSETMSSSSSERSDLELHLASCASCSEDLALARRIQNELRDMPSLSCPPVVTRAVLAHAEAHPPLRVLRLQQLWQRLWTGRNVWQPAFALLVVAALGLGIWRAANPPMPTGGLNQGYTEEEIAQAEEELKLALAYLGNIGDRARVHIGVEVGQRVVDPLTRSIAGALLPFPLSRGAKSGDSDGE